MQRPLNRCQLAGTLMQAVRQVLESQQVVKFELSFGDSTSTVQHSVSCIVHYSWLQKKVIRTPLGSELVISAEISVDRDGNVCLVAYRVDSPAEFELRFENIKRSKMRQDILRGQHEPIPS